jgi:CheY-like chemotaxis protein
MSDSIEVLAVIASGGFYRQIEPLMTRSSLEVTRVKTGSQALPLATHHFYDLILAQYPLPDLELGEFVAAIHDPESACAESKTLILTRDDRLDSMEEFLDGELIRACCVDAPEGHLEMTLTEILGIAPREASRLLVKVEIELDAGTIEQVFQTANLSESGILVRSSHQLPIGAKAVFRLELPDGSGTVAGQGRIVRHTSSSSEGIDGFALRILALDGENKNRLYDFLAGLQATEHVGPALHH